MNENRAAEGPFRTDLERGARAELAELFTSSTDDVATRLDHFPKYVRRQQMTRLLALYEIFKIALNVKGSVINCGVFRGFSLMAFAHFSAILEPVDLTRRIYGFDTFGGFASVSAQDASPLRSTQPGELAAASYDELLALGRAHDANRYLGHIEKVRLVRGDAVSTIPAFVDENPHLVVSLLFLDFDLYGPTKAALEHFVPRMPRGAVIAFDELDNPLWPGETLALLDTIGLRSLQIERLTYDPYIGFARMP
jgi:hypothetical protein